RRSKGRGGEAGFPGAPWRFPVPLQCLLPPARGSSLVAAGRRWCCSSRNAQRRVPERFVTCQRLGVLDRGALGGRRVGFAHVWVVGRQCRRCRRIVCRVHVRMPAEVIIKTEM